MATRAGRPHGKMELRINRQSVLQKNLNIRMRILQAIRNFFMSQNYLEIDTPVRIPAPAPEAYIDAIPSAEWFLQTSPELCMKRLLAAGFPRIFQICKCFRQGERGRKHLPELTMLEWYCAGSDYDDLMKQTEALICFIARQLNVDGKIVYQSNKISIDRPWVKISVADAFKKHASLPMEEAQRKNIFDEVMVDEIEPQLGRKQPVFIFDYPAAMGALARLKPQDRSVAERFELYIGGVELCNGFSELTDPTEQRERFESERRTRRSSAKTVYPMPEPFLNALQDMPSAAGNALGLDRLVMLFTDSSKIDDVVAFVPEDL